MPYFGNFCPFWATAAQNRGVRGYVRGYKILRRSNLKKLRTSVHAPGAGLQALEVWGHLETMVKCEVFLHLQVNTKEPTLYWTLLMSLVVSYAGLAATRIFIS